MQINLKQAEIEVALRDYVSKLGISLEGREVDIVFTNGRKSNGLSADIEISDTVAVAATPAAVAIPSTPIQREIVAAPVQSEPIDIDGPDSDVSSPATTSLFGG